MKLKLDKEWSNKQDHFTPGLHYVLSQSQSKLDFVGSKYTHISPWLELPIFLKEHLPNLILRGFRFLLLFVILVIWLQTANS